MLAPRSTGVRHGDDRCFSLAHLAISWQKQSHWDYRGRREVKAEVATLVPPCLRGLVGASYIGAGQQLFGLFTGSPGRGHCPVGRAGFQRPSTQARPSS